MKKRSGILFSLLAIIIALSIVILGAVSIYSAKDLLPTHKGNAVAVPLSSGGGLYFAQMGTDITLSYPWSLVSESTEYTDEGVPGWLQASGEAFSRLFPVSSIPVSLKNHSFTVAGEIWFLNAEYSAEGLGVLKNTRLAIKEGGGVVAYISETQNSRVDSKTVNQVYEVIGKAAFDNQSSQSNMILLDPLDSLTRGESVARESLVYNEDTKQYDRVDLSSHSFFDKDPVEDFFRKYCRYCSENGVSNREAQQIYTLLRYGTYACIYSNGQIYLTYSLTDFGTLTLVWDVASTELSAMSLDAGLTDK
ncbi:MAG: hypothetical protein IKL24_00630 [Clostridia bacterium]|nr:hypothetical protein [Clostridia bacterium]